MKRNFITFFVFTIIYYSAEAQVKLSVAQFDSMIRADKNIQVIDVRTDAEIASGMIERSKQINYSNPDFENKLKMLDKSKAVAVYCAAGGRSGKTAAKLIQLGFTKVYDLPAGMTGWKAAGKKTVQKS